MTLIVSAYTASPAHVDWDPAFEQRFLEELAALSTVTGIELPWIGRLHPHDDAWLLRYSPRGLDLALTGLPHVVARAATTPAYGLASPDREGRVAALRDASALRDDAARLADAGVGRVRVVELHTAPRGGGSASALAASLSELAGWDWSGAELVIEHCDAVRPGQSYEKGFLTLEREIEAIRSSGAPVGLWLNWGRSAVELRDADTVAAQIARARSTGLLRGLAFSGASATASAYGKAWADAHLPIASAGFGAPEGASLLTPSRVREAVHAAGPIQWVGLKVARRPGASTVETIVDDIRAQADLISIETRRADIGNTALSTSLN